MKTNFNSIWKYIVGGGTVLGYQAFIDRIANRNKSLELINSIKSLQEKIDNMENSNQINNKINIDFYAKQQQLKIELNRLLDIHNKYLDVHQGILENSEKSKNLFQDYKKEFTDVFNKAKELGNELENYSSDLNNKLNDESFITKMINEYKNYLSTLSTTEICLVINISSSLFILGCLVSIIFSIYGNFLIDKLALADKYPKLTTLIQLRVKLQHSYIITNTILIILALISMIILNYITLTIL